MIANGDCYILAEVKRADSDDPNRGLFREIVDATMTGKQLSQQASDLLISRLEANVDSTSFENAMTIAPTRNIIDKANNSSLEKLKKPIFKQTSTDAPRMTLAIKEDFGYFLEDLYLCEGAQIVINKNLHVDAGIYNGAKGQIVRMLFEDKNLKYLVIDLEKTRLQDSECYEQVPKRIVLKKEKMYLDDRSNWREQFPVNLAYGMTIYKVQGQTLDKVIIDFGKRQLRYGEATVAFSRTKKAEDFMLKPFDMKKVFEMTNEAGAKRSMQNKVVRKM